MTPSKLFGIALLLFCVSGMLIWITSLMDAGSLAFDCSGLILLGLSVGLLILSLLFLWRAKGVRFVTSMLLHLVSLALLATLPFTVPAVETTMEKMIVVALTLLGAGLLFLAILALHNDAMKNDFAAAREQISRGRTRPYLVASIGCMLLFLGIVGWQIVPLLTAQPTITVDYLAQANVASRPINYDPNRNAVPYYEKLFSQFTPLPKTLKDKYRLWPTDLSQDEFEALEKWAPVNESALSVLAHATRCPYWWYELKSTDGAMSNIPMPDLDCLRECAWGILLLAKYQAAQGNAADGLQLLTDLHMFGVHLAKGATLVEQLAGVALCKLSYDAVLALLNHGEVDRNDLKSALHTLALQIPWVVVPRFSEVEHLYGRDCIQRVFTDDGKGNGRLIPRQLYQTKKNRTGPYTHPISYLNAVRICLQHPDRRSTLQLYETYFTLVRDLANQTPWGLYVKSTSCEGRLQGLLSGNYYLQDSHAAIGSCIRIGWRGRVSGDATVAILAIFAYKAQEGRLPESLQQLVDKDLLLSVPMDPYSGTLLIYKVKGDSFTLYSVGEDFVDNGGVHCEWSDQGGGDHVFWPVPAAPSRSPSTIN